MEEKNKVSHRGKALEIVKGYLEDAADELIENLEAMDPRVGKKQKTCDDDYCSEEYCSDEDCSAEDCGGAPMFFATSKAITNKVSEEKKVKTKLDEMD